MKTSLALLIVTSSLAFTNPAFSMTEAECEQAFATADTDKDGVLTEAEAARYFAMHRVAEKPIADGKLTRAQFLTNCKAKLYDTAAMEASAPLKGANSFTEAQAKDRAVGAGFTDVSGLTKDGDGIWRGTAMMTGKKVNLAVDYKGNVVGN